MMTDYQDDQPGAEGEGGNNYILNERGCPLFTDEWIRTNHTHQNTQISLM